MWFYWVIGVIVLIILSSLKVVKEYERGVRFLLGKFSGVMKPGLRMILPVIHSWQRVDIRVKAVDVPDQECITKDNITVGINAVIYYKVSEAKKAVIEVEQFQWAVSQIAQTTMRNIVGEVELDQLLSERDEISKKIQLIVDKATDPWGIKVDNVDLKDITLPQEMKRVIGKQAEAEREKRAVIIKAQGEVMAASNMAKAANTLSAAPGALHLRTLQTINDLSSDQSNTIIFALPVEVLRAFEAVGMKLNKKKG
ncbi:MAG: slipin family protein [Nanoarchaeota archaeon]|nr:slipin family protein [Nanoarchaeota archaeon]MBU1321526.1 slipin family protein [Nanoarchaeota archaeon]MBU1597164.1 slipin family protein [Nanoarchaeota archaeon]MBU2441151.1 slipin family protein [Nanoarchaeota archaeon]